MDTGISLDTYKIFCAVARSGNMSSAAKELFISQPAVSMAVKQLEERLGGQLLVRTPKGVRLTPEGRVLFNYLDMAFNMVKTAEHKYFELANLEKGEVRIGASDVVISGYLMPYIEKFSIFPSNPQSTDTCENASSVSVGCSITGCAYSPAICPDSPFSCSCKRPISSCIARTRTMA